MTLYAGMKKGKRSISGAASYMDVQVTNHTLTAAAFQCSGGTLCGLILTLSEVCCAVPHWQPLLISKNAACAAWQALFNYNVCHAQSPLDTPKLTT
jgi:hypothetical protein